MRGCRCSESGLFVADQGPGNGASTKKLLRKIPWWLVRSLGKAILPLHRWSSCRRRCMLGMFAPQADIQPYDGCTWQAICYDIAHETPIANAQDCPYCCACNAHPRLPMRQSTDSRILPEVDHPPLEPHRHIVHVGTLILEAQSRSPWRLGRLLYFPTSNSSHLSPFICTLHLAKSHLHSRNLALIAHCMRPLP